MKTITYNPETHVLVPREPSQGMIDAMPPVEEIGYWAMYEAAIAAAPQPEPNHNWCAGCSPDNCSGCGTKPVESEPVGYVDYGDRVEWYKKPIPETDLYTTPQPDRTAELEAELTALKAENESLLKDAERLDWVEHQDFHDLSFAILVDQPNDGMTAVSISEGWHLGNNLREAIDAAMAQGEKG